MSAGLDTVRDIREGRVRAVDVLARCVARIEATDGRVNAFTDLTLERARREAEAVDEAVRRGLPTGPLAGLPYAVKNLFDIEGVTTRAGSKLLVGSPAATADAVLVARMRAAGAVLLGGLNMDEFAYGFTTENSHVGACHNPRDLACTAGGSSGGCGAAVAAGQVPVSLGSDTNGSIRVPSSLCGVFGLKPTFGRLSRTGSYPFVASIDHLGPFARTVADLSATYDVLQGADPLDPSCVATRVQPTLGGIDAGIAGLRIGALGGWFDEQAGPSARKASNAAAALLGAARGIEWPHAALARAAAFITTASEGGSLHLPELRERASDFEPHSVDRFIAGALQPVDWYLRAQRFRRVYRRRVLELFEHWDVLIAPATPVSATRLGAETFDLNGCQVPTRPSLGLLTQPISFAGCPVVAAPLWPDADLDIGIRSSSGGDDGLPIGVQIIAAPWREDLALRVARVLEVAGLARSPIAKL